MKFNKTATPESSEEEIVYVLPPRFAIVGKALMPVVHGLREALAQDVGQSHHEFAMPESLSRHMGVIQRVLERLPARVDGLVKDSVSTDESDIAQVHRAVGRLEEVLLDCVEGYQEAKAFHVQPEFSEIQILLVGVYHHHLLEMCNWLTDLVEAIANPMDAMKKRGIPMGTGAMLTLSLSMTVPPEMAKLLDFAKPMQIELAPEIEPTPIDQQSTQSGPGILGTMGALAFGIGITKAVLGRRRS